MENKNTVKNLFIRQAQNSDALGYNLDYLSARVDNNFNILGNAYEGSGRVYAYLKNKINNNNCNSENCKDEMLKLQQLEAAPQASLDFLSDIAAELQKTEDTNFDTNNNYMYSVANSVLLGKPGFSKTEGYDIVLDLLDNGSQEITFSGPFFERPLIINSVTLGSLLDSDTSIVATTPDINKDMLRLLVETGIFNKEDVSDEGDLLPTAKIQETFILKGPDQKPDYEIIDIGMGKGRNVLRFDLDKIEKKATPFINAEVAGLLSSEQEAVAAWNVYIAKGSSVEEDDQMVQDANAGSLAWSYEEDLPLTQNNKELFLDKYKKYFMNNYLKQFITNKVPTVEADAAVFDLAEAKKAKAEKLNQSLTS